MNDKINEAATKVSKLSQRLFKADKRYIEVVKMPKGVELYY